MAGVTLKGVVKRYGTVEAVRGISLDIPDKQFVALVGPSGCGKSTMLRMIAGLEQISEGEIRLGGEIINDVAPADRDIAMVFQNYALYPHMTVFGNMAFALRMRRIPKADVKRRVEDAAAILHITELLGRLPRQLSGGQRQRVAMGRAIVRNPQVFLFDEPLSNLDAKLRVQMRTEIKRLHQKIQTTTIYVTHDQVEAMTLADCVVVMNGGKIEQFGRPHQLYHSPKTRFVAGFIGSPAMNFIECRLEHNGSGLALSLADGFAFAVPPGRTERYGRWTGKPLVLGLRPEHITEVRERGRPDSAEFAAPLEVVESTGGEMLVFFKIGATDVCARIESTQAVEAGQRMPLQADLRHMHLIDPTTNVVL